MNTAMNMFHELRNLHPYDRSMVLTSAWIGIAGLYTNTSTWFGVLRFMLMMLMTVVSIHSWMNWDDDNNRKRDRIVCRSVFLWHFLLLVFHTQNYAFVMPWLSLSMTCYLFDMLYYNSRTRSKKDGYKMYHVLPHTMFRASAYWFVLGVNGNENFDVDVITYQVLTTLVFGQLK